MMSTSSVPLGRALRVLLDQELPGLSESVQQAFRVLDAHIQAEGPSSVVGLTCLVEQMASRELSRRNNALCVMQHICAHHPRVGETLLRHAICGVEKRIKLAAALCVAHCAQHPSYPTDVVDDDCVLMGLVPLVPSLVDVAMQHARVSGSSQAVPTRLAVTASEAAITVMQALATTKRPSRLDTVSSPIVELHDTTIQSERQSVLAQLTPQLVDLLNDMVEWYDERRPLFGGGLCISSEVLKEQDSSSLVTCWYHLGTSLLQCLRGVTEGIKRDMVFRVKMPSDLLSLATLFLHLDCVASGHLPRVLQQHGTLLRTYLVTELESTKLHAVSLVRGLTYYAPSFLGELLITLPSRVPSSTAESLAHIVWQRGTPVLEDLLQRIDETDSPCCNTEAVVTAVIGMIGNAKELIAFPKDAVTRLALWIIARKRFLCWGTTNTTVQLLSVLQPAQWVPAVLDAIMEGGPRGESAVPILLQTTEVCKESGDCACALVEAARDVAAGRATKSGIPIMHPGSIGSTLDTNPNARMEGRSEVLSRLQELAVMWAKAIPSHHWHWIARPLIGVLLAAPGDDVGVHLLSAIGSVLGRHAVKEVLVEVLNRLCACDEAMDVFTRLGPLLVLKVLPVSGFGGVLHLFESSETTVAVPCSFDETVLSELFPLADLLLRYAISPREELEIRRLAADLFGRLPAEVSFPYALSQLEKSIHAYDISTAKACVACVFHGLNYGRWPEDAERGCLGHCVSLLLVGLVLCGRDAGEEHGKMRMGCVDCLALLVQTCLSEKESSLQGVLDCIGVSDHEGVNKNTFRATHILALVLSLCRKDGGGSFFGAFLREVVVSVVGKDAEEASTNMADGACDVLHCVTAHMSSSGDSPCVIRFVRLCVPTLIAWFSDSYTMITVFTALFPFAYNCRTACKDYAASLLQLSLSTLTTSDADAPHALEALKLMGAVLGSHPETAVRDPQQLLVIRNVLERMTGRSSCKATQLASQLRSVIFGGGNA